MGTHLRVLSESYLMNTNMTGLRCFLKSLRSCALDESSHSIGRIPYLEMFNATRAFKETLIGFLILRCFMQQYPYKETLRNTLS